MDHIDDSSIKSVIFRSYVSLPEGMVEWHSKCQIILLWNMLIVADWSVNHAFQIYQIYYVIWLSYNN